MPFLQKLRIILQSKKFIVLSLLLIILYILIFTRLISYASKLDKNTKSLTGTILSYTIDGDKLSMLIKSQEKIKVNYYIDSLSEKEYLENNILLGSTIYLEGEITVPYNNTIPNTFNYKEYLYNNKIYIIFNAEKIILSNKTDIFNKIKTNLIRKINKIGESSAYLHALILGESDYIDNDVYENYKKNGTTHLFAVSGMHIGAVALFLTALFKRMHLKECVGNIIIIIFLIFYIFLVGFTPSVLRGGLLFIFLLINKKSRLNLKTINVLYLLFLILIIINPFYIYNLGFIYSFTTSFGLILFSNKITGNYIIQLIKISTIAFMFSLPITIYNFYEINLLTILNNIIIVPFVTIILFPLTFLVFLLPILSPLLSIGIKILEGLSEILNIFAINLTVPKINIIYILIYYIIILMVYKFHFKYAIFLIVLTIVYKIQPYLDPNSYLYFLDVGQGDSSVIVGNNLNYAIMIDTGGLISYEKESWQKRNKTFDNANNIITFLKSIGISKLDLLIGTHGDIDHIGYADQIINEIKVKNVWLNNNETNDLEKNILSKINKNNFTKLRILNLNNTIVEDENESSLVLYFKIDQVNVLMMGDAPKRIEKEISEQYDFPVDILKVGHHGSKTSTDKSFVEKYQPKYAIISSGRNNRYNHPSIETIETLQEFNIPYYNTQDRGTIVYTIKDQIKKVNFFPP